MPQIRIQRNGPWPRWKLTIRGSLSISRAFIWSMVWMVVLVALQGWAIVQSLRSGANTPMLIASTLLLDVLVVRAQLPFWRRARTYFRDRHARREAER